jgi:hypothetical protein
LTSSVSDAASVDWKIRVEVVAVRGAKATGAKALTVLEAAATAKTTEAVNFMIAFGVLLSVRYIDPRMQYD